MLCFVLFYVSILKENEEKKFPCSVLTNTQDLLQPRDLLLEVQCQSLLSKWRLREGRNSRFSMQDLSEEIWDLRRDLFIIINVIWNTVLNLNLQNTPLCPITSQTLMPHTPWDNLRIWISQPLVAPGRYLWA